MSDRSALVIVRIRKYAIKILFPKVINHKNIHTRPTDYTACLFMYL